MSFCVGGGKARFDWGWGNPEKISKKVKRERGEDIKNSLLQKTQTKRSRTELRGNQNGGKTLNNRKNRKNDDGSSASFPERGGGDRTCRYELCHGEGTPVKKKEGNKRKEGFRKDESKGWAGPCSFYSELEKKTKAISLVHEVGCPRG